MRIRTIPRLLLILAGLSLLALTMFPHHHHGGEFCFVPSHVHTNHSGCDGLNEHSHPDHGAAGCVLNHLTFTLSQSNKSFAKIHLREESSGHDQISGPGFMAFGGLLFNLDFHYESIVVGTGSLTHQNYLHNPCNLRAPPQV